MAKPKPQTRLGRISDTDLDAQTLYRGYKARFQIEFLFRDAKQFTSLSACQARSQAKLHFHFNASMSALTLGKLEARQQGGGAQAGFSMASLKRRAFNQHLLERISRHLAHGHSLEKSSPDYQDLCNYGTITDRAAWGPSEVLLKERRNVCDQFKERILGLRLCTPPKPGRHD